MRPIWSEARAGETRRYRLHSSAAGEHEHQLTSEGPSQAAQLEALGKTLEFALVLLS